MLTPEQLEARKSGIGGSDVAPIMGLSPWKDANAVYLEKRGEIDEDDIGDKEFVHFGNVLEQVVADEYTRRHGEKLQRRNELLRHPKYDFLIANIDRKIVGRPAVFEAKTADKWSRGKWGEDGTDEIPDYYRVQVEHYFNVTGYDEGVLAVLIGGNEFRHYPIQRNAELSEMLMEGCIKFWERVQKGFPPEIDYMHATAIDTLKKMYPGTNGETIELPKNLEHWHLVKKDADAEIAKYKTVSDAARARILHAMGEAACGQFSDLGVQYKRSQVNKQEYVVQATSYFQMRDSKIGRAKK